MVNTVPERVDAFAPLHNGLTISLIATPRAHLEMCRADELVCDVIRRTVNAFDVLPVVEGPPQHQLIVGVFNVASQLPVANQDAKVRECMKGLTDVNLIGADASILDFILDVPSRPICLTVAGRHIDGLVSWADLHKLPVRAALFGLITGFEQSMADAIKHKFAADESWMERLSCGRREKLECDLRRIRDNDSEVDALLHTQFGDKATIVIQVLKLGVSKRQMRKSCRSIEKLRNNVAHANEYVANIGEAIELANTVRDLLQLRAQLEQFRE